MISAKFIKQETEKKQKKIGKRAIKKIEKILEKQAVMLIKKSSRNADFAGRKTIKEHDIEYLEV